MNEESYNRVMNVNLKGPVFFAQKVARGMIWLNQQVTDYCPVIIVITSVPAAMPTTNRAEYCISLLITPFVHFFALS